MQTYTLEPERALVIDQGGGFLVRFDVHSVSETVEVRAGRLGDLRPGSRTLTVYGKMFRIGFATDVALLKAVYVQLPFDARHIDKKPEMQLLLNTRKPQYPDPLPWNPDDPAYPDPLPWQPQPLSGTPARATYIAANATILGTFVTGSKARSH